MMSWPYSPRMRMRPSWAGVADAQGRVDRGCSLAGGQSDRSGTMPLPGVDDHQPTAARVGEHLL